MYQFLVSATTEKIKTTREIVKNEINLAAENGYVEYAELARQSLSEGYLNRAYAYAKAGGKKTNAATAFLTFESSLLLIVPLLALALFWQLRKKKEIETPVQRAIRLSH